MPLSLSPQGGWRMTGSAMKWSGTVVLWIASWKEGSLEQGGRSGGGEWAARCRGPEAGGFLSWALLAHFSKMFSRSFSYACPSGPKTLPRRSQDAPKAPKRAPRAPKRPQDDAKTLPKRPHVGPLGPSKTIEKHSVFAGFSYIQPS